MKGKACTGICCTKIENFGVVLGGNTILENVNLHIHCGELTALIGPNGAGKSTLLRAILGEIPHSGKLKYVDMHGGKTSNPMIGYVPQNLEFDHGAPISVYDLFVLFKTRVPAWLVSAKKMRGRVFAALARVDAEGLIDQKLGCLSGGELQRVLLALSLDPVPNLLLLDEPSSGIDGKGLELFYDMVASLKREYDLSIILISHDLELIKKHADRVILINKTVLACGTPQEVFANPKLAENLGGAGIV